MMNWSKDKAKLNLFIDAIMLVLLMAIAGLGFLIKYVLVPGYKRNELYNSNVELYYMGLTRHEWGSIHLWLSFIFLFLMLLHIILHWKMIKCIFSHMVTGKASRIVIAVFIGTIALFFALSPFFITPVVEPLQIKHARSHNSRQLVEEPKTIVQDNKPAAFEKQNTTNRQHKNQKEDHQKQPYAELEIFGYMTLNEAAQKYSIPVVELTNALNIPSNQSGNKIGRLKKLYDFEMEDLKDIILKINNNN